MKRILCVTASLALSAAFSSSAMADNLVVGFAVTPTTLDPHADSSAPNSATSRHIWDSLVNLTGTSGSAPELAESWSVIDDTHWEFKLRQGVNFHDGTPFDAEDAIASLLRARDLPTKKYAAYTRNIVDVTATDPHTIVIETKTPDPMLLNSISRIRVVSNECASQDIQSYETGKCAIGTGAFKFVEYTPGDRLVLERNDDYFAGPADWEKVTLRFIPDDGARLASLLSKEVDLIESLPPDGTARVEGNADFQIITGTSSRFAYLGLDTSRDDSPFITGTDGKNPLKDQRVRLALLKAMNREAIVDRVMQKNGTVADQFVGEGYLGHSDAVVHVDYDVEGAKALLTEAGYPNGFGITLHGPQGRYVKDSEVVQALAQMLSRINIDAKVEVQPWSVYSEAYGNGAYSAFFGAWGVNTGEVSNPTVALIASRDAEKGTGRYNGGNVSDGEIDALLAQASATLDEEERRPLLEEISKLAFDRLWVLPLHYENVVLAARDGLNFTPRGDKYTLSYEIKKTN